MNEDRLLSEALQLVGNYFKDNDKTYLWFRTANPQLGNVTPNHLIEIGKIDKLLKFIKSSLEENKG